MAKDRVPVNLADPKDIRAKMPEIKNLLASARQELDALKEQVEMLTRIVGDEHPPAAASVVVSGSSSALASGRNVPKPKPKGTRKAAPAQDRAIEALERARKPMGPASLFHFMETQGMELPSSINRLNAALWAAAKAGRVVKRPDSTYAPVGGSPSPSNGQAQLPGPLSGSSTAALQTSPQALSQGNGGGRPRESEEEKVAPG